jgi:hypothetical protein
VSSSEATSRILASWKVGGNGGRVFHCQSMRDQTHIEGVLFEGAARMIHDADDEDDAKGGVV